MKILIGKLSSRASVLIVTAVMSLAARGQSASTGGWTLQECIDYAMEHNLDLRQKKISVDQCEVDIEAKRGALFPSLSFATNQNLSWRPWSESYVNITDGSMASTTSTVNYNGSYGLQAQWTVWDGGINRKQLERSKISLKEAECNQETSRLTIQEQIVQLYVQILYQTEAVKVCEDVLASTRTQLQRAEGMYEVGKMSKADLAQVQAQVSQEEYNVTNASTQLANFKMQLRQLLEIPGGQEFTVAVPVIDDASVDALLPAVEDVYYQALNTRPEMRYNRLEIEAADLDINIARRERYPTISLQAGINTSASSGLEANWAKQIKTNLSNMLGLTVSVPIFDNKRTSTDVAKAKLARDNADVALSQARRQLYNSIETLWLNAVNAQQQYRSATVSTRSMTASYDLVSEQFAVGLKDIVDLTTAKNNLVQSLQQQLQSKYTAVLNRSLLNFYQNNTLTLN